LTDLEENQIVAFLQTLSDGFTKPYPNIDTFTASACPVARPRPKGTSFSSLRATSALLTGHLRSPPVPFPPIDGNFAPPVPCIPRVGHRSPGFRDGNTVRTRASMNRLLPRLAIATAVASLIPSLPSAAQVLPPVKKAERVRITKAPEVELTTDHLTIIRWSTNNPGGSDVHYGIVHYGTDPQDLSQTAKKSNQVEPGPSTLDVPRAHRGPEATNDVLLQSYLGGKQRDERWGDERRQQVHHTRALRTNGGLPETRLIRGRRPDFKVMNARGSARERMGGTRAPPRVGPGFRPPSG